MTGNFHSFVYVHRRDERTVFPYNQEQCECSYTKANSDLRRLGWGRIEHRRRSLQAVITFDCLDSDTESSLQWMLQAALCKGWEPTLGYLI